MTLLSAGDYLRLRREAFGLTIAEVARSYVHQRLAPRLVELLLQEAEAGAIRLEAGMLTRLRAVYPFDARVYARLARGEPASVCLRCGCSWDDPCTGAPTGSCAWANSAETLCNACIPAAIVRRAQAGAHA